MGEVCVCGCCVSFSVPSLSVTMPKFLKPGKVVILLQGRFAGKKAVIVKNYDDGTGNRPYGHAPVCGIEKYPRKVTKKQTEKQQAKHCRVKSFIKVRHRGGNVCGRILFLETHTHRWGK